jgi:hypothetical protein
MSGLLGHDIVWVSFTSFYFTISSKEVLSPRSSASRYSTPIIRHSTEDCEFRFQILLQTHNRSHITTAVTVIRRRPHSNHILVFEMVFVALIDKLMSTRDELEAIDVVELVNERGCVSMTCSLSSPRGVRSQLKRFKVRTSVATLSPNNHPAPLGLIAHVSTSSGSLHTRSQKAPSCGISCALATTRI